MSGMIKSCCHNILIIWKRLAVLSVSNPEMLFIHLNIEPTTDEHNIRIILSCIASTSTRTRTYITVSVYVRPKRSRFSRNSLRWISLSLHSFLPLPLRGSSLVPTRLVMCGCVSILLHPEHCNCHPIEPFINQSHLILSRWKCALFI